MSLEFISNMYLYIEDDEEYMREVGHEAEKKFLAGITPTDEFDKETDDTQKRQRYILVGAIILLVIIIRVVISVLVEGGGGGTVEESPTLTSSLTIAVDPDFSANFCDDAIQILPATKSFRIRTTTKATTKRANCDQAAGLRSHPCASSQPCCI